MYPMKKLDLEKDEWIAFINQGLEEITDLAHVVSPSIFMAPSPLRGLKLESFLPQVVAIGPYHNEMGPHHSNFPQTAETERYKLIAAKEMEKYKILAARETAKNFKRNHFKFLIEEFLKVLDQVRQEYGSDFECESDEALAYTLGLDASFVIEVLRCSGETKDSLSGFGAFYAGRFPRPLRKSIIQDFMLLENQIPLFLLQKVIRAHMNCHSDDDADGTLGSLISKAATEVLPFSGLSPGSLRSVVHDLGSRKHLLDCLYCISTFTSSAIGKTEIVEKPTQFPTAVELYNSGISFGRTEGNATDVRFDEKKGVLHLPKVRVGDETEKLFRNLIAYESHLVDKVEVLSYLRFMNCLVDTPGDVALLAEKGVIVQDIGSNEGVADMWNNLCMNTMRVCSGEYEKVAIALNRHSKRKVNALMAEFKRTYLSRPWLVVSLVSGIALLIMTFLIMWYENFASTRNSQKFLRSCYSYTSLFNLESLLNFQLPHAGDESISCTSSSLEVNESSKGDQSRLKDFMNGGKAKRPAEFQPEMTVKRKRLPVEAEAGCNARKRDDADSNDDHESNDGTNIDEEHYRAMLGEHLKRHRKAQLKEAIAARFRAATNKRTLDPDASLSNGTSTCLTINKKPDKPSFIRPELYAASFIDGIHPTDSFTVLPSEKGLQQGLDEGTFAGTTEDGTDPKWLGVSEVLDLGDGIMLEIPPFYDQLAPLLHLPDFGAIQIDERLLSGQLKSGVVVSMVASDPLAKLWKTYPGVGESFNSTKHDISTGKKKFSLQVFDSLPARPGETSAFSLTPIHGSEFLSDTPDSSSLAAQPGSPITWRHILSESGVLRQCEVKVLERGDCYEVIERRIPKREPVKRDPAALVKEDNEKVGKYWVNLVRKDLPKHQKFFFWYYRKQSQDAKKFAECCQREVKYRGLRSLKVMKAGPMRIRKLARDMIIFWKKVDREQADLRKREEKEAAEALKREEELREARRQQQRLNFLLTQTELYSHFMQNKLAGLPAQTTVGSAAIGSVLQHGVVPRGEAIMDSLAEDAAEEAALKDEALRAAQNAASQQRKKTDAFDSECLKLRQSVGADAMDQLPDIARNMDLLHPSSMPVTSSVQQPTFFCGSLKEYQLKGLQWLVNCYEQGLNGILADEMGLGKTIQAMAFLAHLAEEKNIWGPFLVVAPASVLNNWADEVHRFCPVFKILPYWGGLQERTVLRKNISPKRLYRRDAIFHILITSYQLLVSDEKYLRRVKWQYMVLDEAQAIKSSSSIRWKTLLSFNCRNRLLLTGTPIQNNMAELWALLHFIMPTLFDSHEQFNEWFSKGIESHAEHGGTLNEHQLNRLHSILKPFMLRRVKKDVITEMTNKKEVVIPCTLSSRQLAFYQAIKNKISLADLFDGSGGHMNEKKVLNLMNIVIQLRKVCNHPELFERNEGHTFVHFTNIQNSLLPPPFGEMEYIHYAGSANPISYKVPKLLFRDGMRCLPTAVSGSVQGFQDRWINNLFNIFSPQNVHTSALPVGFECVELDPTQSGCFGFTRLIDLSPSEVKFLAKASIWERLLFSVSQWDRFALEEVLAEQFEFMDNDKVRAVSRLLMLPLVSGLALLKRKLATGLNNSPFEALAMSHQERFSNNIGLLRSVNTFMPAVRAPLIEVVCPDRGFAYQREEELQNPWIKRLLLGFARTSEYNGPALPCLPHPIIQEQDLKVYSQRPILALPHRIFGWAPPLQNFDFAKMLTDSGKLQTLDVLLKRLRVENHRVLLFAQMTKMLNILEDYMNYRKYKYLRLDGSSTIMDRRDMVKDFQHRSDIFVFLLSTRAGGLGINLTAADTVIFYESDWNPTMDLQAMDRAHRLGQTKEVTVYRLICKGTVEEKIVKRASQKNTVQQLVMTGGHSQGDVFEADEVVSLLLDDAELEQRMKEQVSKQAEKLERRKKGWGVPGGMKAVRLDAEGGAFLEEEQPSDANGERLSDGKIANVEKGASSMENGVLSSKQRQGKKKHDGEGKPPKPPKIPKPIKDKESTDLKSSFEPKDFSLTKPRGRSRKSASVAAMTSGKHESMQVISNGSEVPSVDNSIQSKEACTSQEGIQQIVALETSAEMLEDVTTFKSWSSTETGASLARTGIGTGREGSMALDAEDQGSVHNNSGDSEGRIVFKARTSTPKKARNDTSEPRVENEQFNPNEGFVGPTGTLSISSMFNDRFQRPVSHEEDIMPFPQTDI